MIIETINSCRKVYNRLQDDLSRKYYEYAIMYSLTGDEQYVGKTVMLVPEVKKLKDELERKKGQPCFLFGAGMRGERIIPTTMSLGWEGVIDNNKEKIGKMISGVQVYSPNEVLKNYNNAVVVVPLENGFYSVKESLIDSGFEEENIINFGDSYTRILKGQYFDLTELPNGDEEIFVDCGCFDGESSISFFDWAQKDNAKAYCLEPDEKNYEECEIKLSDQINRGRCTLIKKGTWSCDDVLDFEASGNEGSSISENGNTKIEVTSIDKVLNGEKATFIKMDIEGAELEALKGAENTIRTYCPKLAISVYHLSEDIFIIPEYILKLNNHYEFYLRHYSVGSWDTVLYAVPGK